PANGGPGGLRKATICAEELQAGAPGGVHLGDLCAPRRPRGVARTRPRPRPRPPARLPAGAADAAIIRAAFLRAASERVLARAADWTAWLNHPPGRGQ